jgi:hypothetical protein
MDVATQQRLYDALRRIATGYDTAQKVIDTSEKRYGLEPLEALEMAYDNIQMEAVAAIRHVRRPKAEPTESPTHE